MAIDTDLHAAISTRTLGGLIGNGRFVLVAITSALTGSLTIGGLCDPTVQSGTPGTLVIPPASVGVFTTALTSANGAFWQFSNAVDAAKACIVWNPR